MEPLPVVYSKFKSKLYSIDVDIFLQEKLLEHDLNFSKVKE